MQSLMASLVLAKFKTPTLAPKIIKWKGLGFFTKNEKTLNRSQPAAKVYIRKENKEDDLNAPA